MMPRKAKKEPVKSEIAFSVVRKSVFVIAQYDPVSASGDRLALWQMVGEFGLEIAAELTNNYRARLTRLVHYETKAGEIVFDIASTASIANRRRAVETVQTHYHVMENSFMLPRPEHPQ
jgi:hypothetical protein